MFICKTDTVEIIQTFTIEIVLQLKIQFVLLLGAHHNFFRCVISFNRAPHSLNGIVRLR